MAQPSQAQTFAETDEGAGGAVLGESSSRAAPPRTPYEEAIVAIWGDLLGHSDIGVFDDFFALGGHPLLASAVVARIRKTLGVHVPVMDFVESSTVAALASRVAARSSPGPQVVNRRPPDADPVLSFDQQRIWLENQLAPGEAYNVHGRRRLIGPIKVDIFEASIRAILGRHDTLRTRFPIVAGRPVQVVDDPDENWRIRVRDVTGVDDPAGAARRLADEEAATPFDMVQGPLFRCLLVRVSDTEHLFAITVHHIISDAWSIRLFVQELAALYQAGGEVNRADLPTLPVQYRDYAVWQRGRLAGEALERLVSYWRGHLAGAPPALVLPAAQRRSPAQGADGGRVQSALSEQETVALHDLCRKQGVTTFMALLASLATVLGRWSGQSDVVIGVPIAGRTNVGTDKLIGFFVNTLPLRVDLSGDPTFADLLGRVRRVALDGYAHADAPLDVLVQELQVTRDPRRTPLFQVILNVIGSPVVEQITGVAVEPMDTPVLPPIVDLVLTAQESDGAIHIYLDFDASRYQAEMVRTLVAHLRMLLRAAVADPTRGILSYPFQSAGEAAGTEISPADRPAPTPHLAVGGNAQLLEDRVAVIDRDGEWSYRWLSQKAGQVAQLLAQRPAPQADHLGVVRRPTAAFVAALLGCRIADATFTVIEAADARPRDLGVSTVLDVGPTSEAADATIDLSPLLRAQTEPSRIGPEGASGSPALNGDWAVERFHLGREDRFTVLSNSSDHLLSALSSVFYAEATLVIPEHPVSGDIGGLTTWLHANSISVMYVSPPILRAIAASTPRPELPALRYVFVHNSGGFISHDVDALRRLSATCRCVGLYRVGQDGRPLAMYAVPDDWQLQTAPLRVPLGAELEDDPAHLLHPSGQPAAIGEVAEICFGSRRTGDLGRRWLDGSLEFVSHLGGSPVVDYVETVAALRDVPEVRDAVVTEHAGMDGGTMLLGYVVGPDPGLGTAGIRQHLVVRLPDYLVPDQLFVLDELPLTPEGDYDLSALPGPGADSSTIDSYVAPRTPMERQLAEVLQELLAIDRVGLYDIFFELGGVSLLATRLTTRIRDMFGVELSLRDVFESPTVDGLAQLIVRTQGELAGAEDLEALLDEIQTSGLEGGEISDQLPTF
jgi:non-ribosomal peptide synthetase component F/acyl carrier protein